MDLNQLSQMVSWLDEEHRRDRDEIARLDQRLQTMAVERQEQARRIQDLEGRLASTVAQLTRFTQIEQALQQLKNEVVVLLDKQTEERLHAEREAERIRLSDREALGRNVAELRKELGRLKRVEEDLATRQAEDQRLGEMVLTLRQSLNNANKEIEERTRSLPYMVEQRSQDNKRIAEIQGEHLELIKRTEAFATRQAALEERAQRLEKDMQRVQPLTDQIRRDQQAFLEAQRLADVERERQMARWTEEFAQQAAVIERQEQKQEQFAARHELAGRTLKALEDFQAQIIQGQKQTSELQRLAEDRQRKELAGWQAENEQRWKKETLRWDYTIQEQQKTHVKVVERLTALEKHAAVIQRELESLWRLQENLGSAQLQSTQKLLDAVEAAMAARPKPEA